MTDAPMLKRARAMAADLVRLRRDLHRMPEIAYEEHETTAFVAGEVERLGLTPVRPLATGMWVDIDPPGRTGGERVLVRADMDGLPVAESTGLAFASRNEGRMHACGHDSHMAMALGALRLLAEHRDELQTGVRVLFQPAEEGGAGAQRMIDAGALESVRSAVGLHVFAQLPERVLRTGEVAVRTGPLMAASDRLEIIVRGRGGHGSMPHTTVDAIPVAAHIVVALQQVVARQLNPQRAAVLTIGTIRGGFAPNVIAPEVRLAGTVRTLDAETKASLRAAMETIVRNTAAAFGAEATVEYRDGYPVLVNDAAVSAIARAAAEEVVGADGLVDSIDPVMAGEDFAYIAQAVPSAFLFLGVAPPGADAVGNHDPRFSVDEESLPLGTAILASAAVRLSNEA